MECELEDVLNHRLIPAISCASTLIDQPKESLIYPVSPFVI